MEIKIAVSMADIMVLDLVRKLISEKKERGSAPFLCTKIDLHKAIDQHLNELYANDEIRVGKTVNDVYIILKE